METEVLRWFQQVADGVTVTELSEVERLTQPGVSRALGRLEAEVGAQLLYRSGRRLRLTQAGAVFRRHVDVVLHELDDGLAAVTQAIDPETGTVTLGFPLTLGTWLVPDLLHTFRGEHPDIRFELRQRRDELLATAREQDRADLEISTVRPRDSDWNWELLMLEPLGLAVPRDHHLANRASVALADAAGEPFIVLRTTSRLRQLGDELCASAGFAPQIAFVAADVPTAYGFVAAGLGVAIVPGRHAGAGGREPSANDPVRFVAIEDVAGTSARREIGIVWSARARLLPAAERFRAHVLNRAANATLPPPV
jgi:DNA-binding transcriptional LysR family regulator